MEHDARAVERRRRHLVSRARAIPLGAWSAAQQFNVRCLVVDLTGEMIAMIRELRATRAAEKGEGDGP
jgi:hypothetical protein